ncbi:MAG: hypothetical protein JNK49_07570 [Planctomycetes bacterium]|nr:hypothetical protein [Planctomycetota bacterium]
MTVLQITCDNCGAKYKLPETFQGNQAKCQKCGSVIDVAKQRTPSAAAPGAAAPAAKPAAAAKPAVDRSQAPPAAAARPPKPAERPTRRGRGGDDGDDAASGKGERRGRGEKPAKKSNSMPLIAGGIGLVAVVVVVVLMMKGGDKNKPDTQQQAQQAPVAQNPTPQSPAKPAAEAPKPVTPPAAQEAPKDPPKEAAEAPKPVPPPPSQPAAPAEKDPNKPWLNMRNPPQAMDQVTDPKSYAEVRWPEGIDAAKQTEVRELAEAACQDGASGMRAANKLKTAANEYPALFAIVERLRLLDYRQSGDAMIGLALNKLLEEILFDLNARYAAVDAEENIVPAKAEWNTNTVKAWLGVLDRYPDADAFKSDRQKRKAKAAEKDK